MFERWFSDKFVARRYVVVGATIGDALSYCYIGIPVGFVVMHKRWEKWEKEYARRGYRTISLDDFIEYGGYDESLKNILVKRNSDEQPVFHATIYRERYMNTPLEPQNLLHLKKGRTVSGRYVLPSTKDESKK